MECAAVCTNHQHIVVAAPIARRYIIITIIIRATYRIVDSRKLLGHSSNPSAAKEKGKKSSPARWSLALSFV
jgi:hypothetical protein